jgi:phosphoribosyl 1,2-cyclic phosphate phosphodiesterase
MKKKEKFLFLGTAGSMGIPVIGCHCSVCASKDPHNKRKRPSALITIDDKKILIDCGPDFHAQAIQYQIDQLDGFILTHGHYDHTSGIDELRVYHMHSGKALPCLLSQSTARDIMNRFSYIFTPDSEYDKLVAKFDLQILPYERGEVQFLDIPIHYFSYEQARMQVNGFRFGNLAYVTDIRKYPNTVFEDLKGVETLVLSALRFAPSHLHLSVDEAVDFANRVGAKMTWLTHLAHELDHEKTNVYLPENIKLAYDGLEINFEM